MKLKFKNIFLIFYRDKLKSSPVRHWKDRRLFLCHLVSQLRTVSRDTIKLSQITMADTVIIFKYGVKGSGSCPRKVCRFPKDLTE